MTFGCVFTVHTSVSTHNARDRECQSVQRASTDMASAQYAEKPKPGDLIEISRGTYQHWAVYIGDGCVVHLAPDSEGPGAGASSLMSVLTNTAIVKKEELWEVVGTSDWRVNNLLDTKYQPRSVYLIVRDALDLVGEELPYDIFSRNCEHFATQLRYGKAQSRQL
ncbi:retinoic acid receptor responder protein 3-like isoform X2 [Hippocampus comes]|uniref:retinoic acid receptor responder protein 3-like isoform X2 n=1 Tax=Hippocampus comes TaxID=109280 RepID=UPI00094E7ADE|nr:PREDICTED: retinoic acid receptor responder protein 3-like isoform X2 [Hippocampus comes]